jgi:hypothetical protein
MPQRRLHEQSGCLAAEVTVRQTLALNILVAVPNGRVAVLSRTIQVRYVFQHRRYARLALLRLSSEAGFSPEKQCNGYRGASDHQPLSVHFPNPPEVQNIKIIQ